MVGLPGIPIEVSMTEIDETNKPKPSARQKTVGKKTGKTAKTGTKKATTGKASARKTAAKKSVKKSTKKKGATRSGPPPGTLMTEALGETFLVDLITDWQDHGGGVIENCRTTKPDAYLKLVATYAPKEFRKTLEPFEGMSDRDLKTRFHEALEEIRTLGLDLGS